MLGINADSYNAVVCVTYQFFGPLNNWWLIRIVGRPAVGPGRALWPPPRVTFRHHHLMLKRLRMPYDLAILRLGFYPPFPQCAPRSFEVRCLLRVVPDPSSVLRPS
jgi:hypothetical protein